ncbi:MAG TPA: DUF1449 family protein [Bacteroidetes bacterium]|nr:DUF1449 family protein [Bacteroidota bacterium]
MNLLNFFKLKAMQDLLQAALSPASIVYTLLLIVVLFYWLGIIAGALDISAFDIDVDMDADVDVDVDVDVDADVDAGAEGGGAGWFAGALQFFNFGKLPFMLIMSFVLFFAWAISILAHYYVGHGSLLFSLALLFPNLFVSLGLTKILTTPLVPMFQNLDAGETAVDYIGEECELTLPANPSKMGQAQVIVDHSTLLINVKVSEQKPAAMYKGDKALIVGEDKEKGYYIIEKY